MVASSVIDALAIRACEHAIKQHMPVVLALKIEKYGRLPLPTEPPSYPRSKYGNDQVKEPSAAAPPTAQMGDVGQDVTELERLAKELTEDYRRRGIKAFDGKF